MKCDTAARWRKVARKDFTSTFRQEIWHEHQSLRSQQREQTSWSECHRCSSTLCHVNLSERERGRGRHSLLRGVRGVMASSGRWQTAYVWVCDGEIRPLRGLGDVHRDLSFCQGPSRSVHLTKTLKDHVFLSLWQVCVCVCVCVPVYVNCGKV